MSYGFLTKIGKVKQKNEMEALYGEISPPPKGSTPPEGERMDLFFPNMLLLAWLFLLSR